MKCINQRGFENVRTILVVAIVLLAASNLVTLYWLKAKSAVNKQAAKTEIQQAATTTLVAAIDSDSDGLTDDEETNEFKTDPQKADTDGDGYTDKNELDSGHDPLVDDKQQASQDLPLKEGQVSVSWQEWPVNYSAYQVYRYDDLKDYLVKERGKEAADKDYDMFAKAFTAQDVGTVASGVYAGRKLFIVAYSEPEGPSWGPTLYRVIESKDKEKKPIILSKQSQEPNRLLESLFDFDGKTTIAGLETPDEISIPDSPIVMTKRVTEPHKFIADYPDAKKLFKYDGSEYVFKSESLGCFIIRAKDGTAREYEFKFPFAHKATSDQPNPATRSLKLTFSGKAEAAIAYDFERYGKCGPSGCYNYPSYIKGKEQLVQAGTFSNGDPVWELKNRDESYVREDKTKIVILKDIYDQYYPGWDDKAQEQKQKVSYEQFLADHPLIYWQDPFGSFIELKDAKYIPAVECGKPVIYLYPTKTTTVAVKVAPNGGFSVTEPEYGDGWRVEASPSGELKNLSDGKRYPYLFWEGKGLDYAQPKEGFVVARSEVGKFLKAKLALLGLNAKESAEFMEYWLPRMQAKPYYFVTFVPQREFDRLAPLTVEPRPDTIIRVFMDYRGLDERMDAPEQKIVTPKRRGFTVVEWGGALHN
jgi:hypothetical protein